MSQDTRYVDPDEIDHNNSANESFQSVLQARLARRSILRGAIGSAATAVFGGITLSACGGGDDDEPAPLKPLEKLGFTAVAKSLADQVVVPAGYSASIIYALGDPLTATATAYKNDGSDADFENRAGDHHDGMEYYGLSADGKPDAKASARGLLVMNHEATSHSGSERASAFVHINGGTNTLPRPAAEVDREVPLHGVSVVEVRKSGAAFAYVKDSAFNRRITPLTPVTLSGLGAGSGLMKTKYSTDGKTARGTLNNCGTGSTPWGTTLTGEENWAGYFTRGTADDAARGNDKSVASLKRYGRNQGAASRHGWETGGADDKYARWDISKKGASADGSDDYRNELNTFGYLVEIDPYSKTSAIKKRTSLGRFAHESAAFSKLVEGKPLAVYMGDDSRGEYIYKWVSAANWAAADANPADRIATGDKYLDAGKLYVAKFNADGTGTWIELAIGNAVIKAATNYAFADQADVVVNARLAADAVGATKMDRPEWCASHPVTGEVYFTLTNNSNRTVATTDAANPRAYDDTKGASTKQSGNVNGHIIRVAEVAGDATATTFKWDVYLFGAEAGADKGLVNLSSLTEDQDMSSPDGLWFSRATGLCWIQTDDGAFTDKSNCMMLAGIPGSVGDGAKKTLAYTGKSVDTYIGKAPTADTLKRFLVGPVDCEITGCAETPDGKALFVNIQHPGETITSATVTDPSKYLSHWPGNAGYGAGGPNARPRSATIVITKNDGGVIGS
ncbi:PhoX family protein [Paucibacter sp. M5-1]|uniref:PhoX family protein n=1 Tax=Paucibacter sp. M5-1 TaxID=3015998 RepID=UPI0022B8EF34|nr:PhoX family phosphatase [Paucibacter sp. M5-1]MCZ7883404.1 PhoX family phosphatase [Paucibacter sp. M5-1]